MNADPSNNGKGQLAEIESIGAYLPQGRITNADVVAAINRPDCKTPGAVYDRTGIEERRRAGPNELLDVMASRAVEDAFENASGVDPSGIEFIIIATSSRREMIPPLAPIVANQLQKTYGFRKPDIFAFDLNATCAGWCDAMKIAQALIESGRYRSGIVGAADAYRSIVDDADKNTSALFGDGAGAALVRAASKGGMHESVAGCDGSMAHLMTFKEGYLSMDGREVFREASERMGAMSQQLLEKAGIGVADVTYFIAHQANQRILEPLSAKKLGGRVYSNIRLVGNTSAASVPIALYDLVKYGSIEGAKGHTLLSPRERLVELPLAGDLQQGSRIFEISPEYGVKLFQGESLKQPFAGETGMAVGLGVGISWAAFLFDLGQPLINSGQKALLRDIRQLRDQRLRDTPYATVLA